MAAGRPAFAQSTRIIFLHHSCGHNLIEEGGVREGLAALGYEFYDHGYNGDGLRLADGSYSGTNFDVPGDNTDPDGFAAIFAQPLHDPPDNTFSHLMQYDVIAFKSCYPASNIADDYQLSEYQSYYLSIRDRMDQYPHKLFVIVTQPPQVPGSSDPAEAGRARAFVDWLQSDEYLAGHPNVFVFDFFGHLAGDDNFLRPEYRYDDYDGHPNERANQDVGPLFVDFIAQVAQGYEPGSPPPPVAPPPEQTTEPDAPIVAPPPAAGTVDDFESGDTYLEVYADETGSTFECSVDTGTAHGGAVSLRAQYNLVPEGWGGCERYFDAAQDWSGGSGLSLWLRAEETGSWVTLVLFSGDPGEATPFEVHFEAPTDWTQVIFPWTDFELAEWADPGGLSELDLTRITTYGFSIGADDGGSENTFWVDDVSLVAGEVQPLPQPPPGESPPDVPVEEEPSGGLCPLSTIALPLGAVGVLLARKRR